MRKKEGRNRRKGSRIEQLDPEEPKSFNSMINVIVKRGFHESDSFVISPSPLTKIARSVVWFESPSPSEIYMKEGDKSDYHLRIWYSHSSHPCIDGNSFVLHDNQNREKSPLPGSNKHCPLP